MGNGITRSGYRKHDSFYYLDKLPSRLRQALCSAAFTWDPKWFLDHWNKGKSVDWCIAKIKEADTQMAMQPMKERDGFKWRTIPSVTSETKVKPLYR